MVLDSLASAEVVQLEFNPAEISYDDLLNVFWENHDPTQFNRQGPDYGAQYRSAIFFHTPGQESAAEASKAKMDDGHPAVPANKSPPQVPQGIKTCPTHRSPQRADVREGV